MPVRWKIHSSLVSTMRLRSSFVTTRSGTYVPSAVRRAWERPSPFPGMAGRVGYARQPEKTQGDARPLLRAHGGTARRPHQGLSRASSARTQPAAEPTMSQKNPPSPPAGAPNLQLSGGDAIVAPVSAFPGGVPGNALVVLPLSNPSDEILE